MPITPDREINETEKIYDRGSGLFPDIGITRRANNSENLPFFAKREWLGTIVFEPVAYKLEIYSIWDCTKNIEEYDIGDLPVIYAINTINNNKIWAGLLSKTQLTNARWSR